MTTILVPVDGSDAANRAVSYAIQLGKQLKNPPEIALLNVQYPIRGDVSMFVGSKQVEEYHRDEAMKAMQDARSLLDAAGMRYSFHIGVGEPAEVIAQFEKTTGCSQICMGTRGAGSIGTLLLGSIAQKVIHLCRCPITLVK